VDKNKNLENDTSKKKEVEKKMPITKKSSSHHIIKRQQHLVALLQNIQSLVIIFISYTRRNLFLLSFGALRKHADVHIYS